MLNAVALSIKQCIYREHVRVDGASFTFALHPLILVMIYL